MFPVSVVPAVGACLVEDFIGAGDGGPVDGAPPCVLCPVCPAVGGWVCPAFVDIPTVG